MELKTSAHKCYKTYTNANSYGFRSGTDEEYSERTQLLTELAELEDETVNVAASAAGTSTAKVKEQQGEEIRKQAMECMAKLKADEGGESGKSLSAFVQIIDGFCLMAPIIWTNVD